MAKIIVSCRFQKSANDIADLIRYMATREGVEKLPGTKKYKIASSKQDDLILSVVKHFPQSKKFLEYEDYCALPTRENANEFLDAVTERYADRADELKGLVNYISNRPGVEKLGSHGLFTQFDMPIDLDTVAERVANHDGVIWTEVVSLRREDAERLHFNNAEAWKNLVRRNINEIAKAHRIKMEDLEWYGAFHNTTFLFSMLAKQIVSSAGKRLDELNKMMPLTDSKEQDKICEKKLAHGQKEGADSNGIGDEVYDSQAAEGILTMLDYLISLGNQESAQETEEDTMPEVNYDFDNAYAEYLNDDNYDEDDDYDDEEEYYGLSM